MEGGKWIQAPEYRLPVPIFLTSHSTHLTFLFTLTGKGPPSHHGRPGVQCRVRRVPRGW